MKALLDTSVLVPVFLGDHEHHHASLNLFLRFGKRQVCCAAHTLAELYSTLTRLPGKYRLTPSQSVLCLEEIEQRFTLIDLNAQEYVASLHRASEAGVAGGATYDALIVSCAIKAKAETIYTWNLRHFTQLDFPGLVQAP